MMERHCPHCDSHLVESTSERGDYFCTECSTTVKTTDVVVVGTSDSDHSAVDRGDLKEIYDTFRACSIGDTVSLTSYYPVDEPGRQEYFEYSGEVVESNMAGGMPGIVVHSPAPETPVQARVVCPASEDWSLDIRFVESDGSVRLAGIVTSITITSAASETVGGNQ